MISRIWTALLKAAPVRLWAMIGAGPPLTVGAALLVWIVWKGPWPAVLAGKQLDILGGALWGLLAILAVIIISLAAVRVKAAGLGGTSLEVDGDPEGQPAAATVTTTTTATVGAGPAPSATPTPEPPP